MKTTTRKVLMKLRIKKFANNQGKYLSIQRINHKEKERKEI